MIIPSELVGLDQIHGSRLSASFLRAPAEQPADPNVRFLFLCFTNRCGSNYLAQLLASTGKLHQPEEVFNLDTIIDNSAERNLTSFADYLTFLCRRLGKNGWLTAKLGLWQLVMLAQSGVLDLILPRARFILLERQDRLSQAISMLVALQNGQWTSADAAARPDSALVYDRAAITELQQNIESENSKFLRFFSANQITPKHLMYEALMQDPQAEFADIGDWLGIDDLQPDPSALRISRQENPVKVAWRARYEAGL